jgi:phosphoglycerol transferase MdoB-like AlkP superfamily enzyme
MNFDRLRHFLNPTLSLLRQVGLLLIVMTLTRLIFWFYNLAAFQHVSLATLLTGVSLDLVTISLLCSPVILLQFTPVPIRLWRLKTYAIRTLMVTITLVIVALNLVDCEYYRFTSKRSTADLFTIISAGSDIAQLITSFLQDFWFLILLFVGFIWLALRLTKNKSAGPITMGWKQHLFHVLIVIPCFIIFGRGGLQLKPIGTVELAQYTPADQLALALNTPFTLLKSIGKQPLQPIQFLPEQEANQLFNPIQKSTPQHLLPKNTNVVIILLESFGNEHVGFFNGGKSFTPFFDSILSQSLTFEYGLSNGKKSIEAIPAIVSSIPSLMDNPYISSPYSTNKINSLAHILKNHGYSTAFFHGATNGSMRFDAFAAHAGFNHYFGRYEYNNDKHFDKTWGILDEYFNPWTARKISMLKAPFFATLFTLSSHHPYYIPPHMRKKIRYGKDPICGSINYGDYALKAFFEEAKKQPWYKNTLFVLAADHTSSTSNPLYNERRFMYGIPIAFYDPNKRIKAERAKRIFQHIDIMPTVLDLLNINETFYAFGHSYYSKVDPYALNYLEGTYYFFNKSHLILFSNKKARNLHDFTVKQLENPDSSQHYKKELQEADLRIKAVIQRYTMDILHNKTVVK